MPTYTVGKFFKNLNSKITKSMDTEELYFLAQDHYNNNDIEAALTQLDELIAREYEPAYILKTNILIGQAGTNAEKIDLYTKAIEERPNSKEYYIGRAETYLSMPNDNSGANFEVGNVNLKVSVSNIADNNKWYQKAIDDCNHVINVMEADIYPEDWVAGAYEIKAKAEVFLELYENAIFSYDMAKIMSERYSSVSFTMMAALRQNYMHDYEGALAILDDYVAYVESGGFYEGAVSDTMRAEAYYTRGKLKIDYLNQKKEGLQDLKKVLDYDNSEFYQEEYNNNK